MQIQAKKSLGQNFLKDNCVLDKIVGCVNVTNEDLIIEIGPGKGALTERLKSFNCDIIAFEIDERFKKILHKLEDNRTNIVFNDFLKIKLKEYIKKKYNKIHIIANIPYYVTNLIIRKILDSDINIDDITLMVQNEVADRLSAKPGCKSFSALTVFANIKYDVNKLFVVSRNCFDPIPNVDSAIIQFKKNYNKYNINDIDKFAKLINDSFKSKRKTLKNNLKDYNWKYIEKLLNEKEYNSLVRAEQIPIEIYVEIANNL